MNDKIYKIKEIRDGKHGAEIVNRLLADGWEFISACQVGNADGMDIVYVVGATKELCDSEIPKQTILSEMLES